MTQITAGDTDHSPEARLPRRDIVIMPLLCLLTIAACLTICEVVCRHYFFQNKIDSCLIDRTDYTSGHCPNCTTHLKAAEGSWVTNQYNECGYRTEEHCGAKPKGSVRIALLGSSTSEGLFVAYDQTFAVRTARELTRVLGRPVEIQNLGRMGCNPVCVYHQTEEALALHPDILIMVVDPNDIRHLDLAQMPYRNAPVLPRQEDPTAKVNDPLVRVKSFISSSFAMIAAEHYLFQNTSTYCRIYLHERINLHKGDNADYLRRPFSSEWEKRLDAFDVLLTEMARKSSAAHVPLVLMEVPGLPQVALAKENNLPAGVDPNAFNDRLKKASLQQGVQFIDGLDAFKDAPEPTKLFYVIDEHLNGEGSAFVSEELVKQLIEEQHSALLSGNERQQTHSERNR